MKTKTSAQHIISDPAICHGEPTFRGTRIMVADVLEQVASGMTYEAIIEVALRDWQRCDCQKPVRMAYEAPAAYAPGLVW